MARMPSAEWRPISGNYTADGMGTIYGVTLHIMSGTLLGTDAWFRNARAKASSHFGTGRGGDLRQWVDTRDRAWAQANGNPHWISIENEGRGGMELTTAQLDRCAEVLAWAHQKHNVPLQIATSPAGRGLGHHAMGGRAWGNHLACPGPKIVAQKPEIIRRARLILDGTLPTPQTNSWTEDIVKDLPLLQVGDDNFDVKTLRATLFARGRVPAIAYGTPADLKAWLERTTFEIQLRDLVKAHQAAEGLAVDGVVGEKTWPTLILSR